MPRKLKIGYYPAGGSGSKTSDLLEAVFYVITHLLCYNCRLWTFNINRLCVFTMKQSPFHFVVLFRN